MDRRGERLRLVLICILLGTQLKVLCQDRWSVGHGDDRGWVLRKAETDSVDKRFFAVGSFGISEYTPIPYIEADPDSIDFVNQTQYFNINFLDKRSQRKTFLKEKPIVSGWSDIHYLWHVLDGDYCGLGQFDRSDSRISYEEMLQIRSNPGAFSQQIVRPVIAKIKKSFIDLDEPYDLIWYLNDEPEIGGRHWYWDPSTVRLFHDEIKTVAPSTLTFVGLGPVEGSKFLYDYYLRNRLGVTLPDTLRKDSTCGNGIDYLTYLSTIDGQKLFKTRQDSIGSNRTILQKTILSDSVLRNQIKITTKAYSNVSDILGINSYSFFNQHPKNVAFTVEAMRDVVPEKPLWFFFQGFERNNPGIVKLRCQVFTAIIHGVTGILFYNDDAGLTTYWQEVKHLSSELQSYEHLLTAESIRSNTEGDLRYLIKLVSGRPYVIATNLGEKRLMLNLEGFPNVSIQPLEVMILATTAINGHPLINEYGPPQGNGLSDSWLELYNPTEKVINLTGYDVHVQLAGVLEHFRITSERLLPHGFVTISLNHKTFIERQNIEESRQDLIWLGDKGQSVVDVLAIADVPQKGSVGRDPDDIFNIIQFTDYQVTRNRPNYRSGFWRRISNQADFRALKSLPSTSLVFENKVWVLAGKDISGTAQTYGVWCSSDGKAWQLKNADPPFSENSSAAVFYNRIWIFDTEQTWSSADGISWRLEATGRHQPNASNRTHFLNTLWYVSGDTVWSSRNGKTWATAIENAPWDVERNKPKLLVHGNRLYVIGGHETGSSGNAIYHRDVWSSSDGVYWVQETPESEWPGREGFSVISFNGNIWLLGGVIQNKGINGASLFLNDVWISDSGKNWKQLNFENIWMSRANHCVWAKDNRIWIGGGESSSTLSDLWVGQKQDLSVFMDSVKIMTYGDMSIPVGPPEATITGYDPNFLKIEGGKVSAIDVGITYVKAFFPDNACSYARALDCRVAIRPKQLIVSASDTFRVYGDSNPEIVFRYEGFVFDDAEDDLDVLPEIKSGLDPRTPVGTYEVKPTGGFSRKYSLNLKSFGMEVRPRKLLVKARACSRLYGEANPEFEIEYSGFASGDNVSDLQETCSIVTTAERSSGVGDYNLVPSGGCAINYELVREVSTLRIEPRTLIAWVPDTARLFAEPNPVLSVFYDGFVLNDGISDLKDLPDVNILADQFSPSGSYEIELAGGLADNYRILRRSSTLEIRRVDKIFMYPNPVVDELNILTPFNAGENDFLVIYSKNGRRVFSKKLDLLSNLCTVELPDLLPDVYFYKIFHAGKVYTGKFASL